MLLKMLAACKGAGAAPSTYVDTVLADSPEWFWLSETNTGTEDDLTGNGNTGTYGSNLVSASALISEASGAFSMTTSNSVGLLKSSATPPSHTANSYSLECIIKTASVSASYGLIYIGDGIGSTAREIGIHTITGGGLRVFTFGSNGNGGSYRDFSVGLSTSTIYHIIATKSGSTVNLYVNGSKSSSTMTDSVNVNLTSYYQIGAIRGTTTLFSNSYTFQAGAAWFGTAISDEQAAAHYAAT